jgi:hypothetical protein
MNITANTAIPLDGSFHILDLLFGWKNHENARKCGAGPHLGLAATSRLRHPVQSERRGMGSEQ